jgi:hypothetical protein
MAIKFEDFTIKVIEEMDNRINAVLEECSGELESAAKGNTRVASGQTKGNWRHHVDDAKHEATIGNTLENSIWEEFGTGEHALHGDGRKGGWFYEDEKGNGHFTHGKKPSRAFHHAYTSLKNPIINRIQEVMKGLG